MPSAILRTQGFGNTDESKIPNWYTRLIGLTKLLAIHKVSIFCNTIKRGLERKKFPPAKIHREV